jgi:glucan phosphorylase
MQRYLTLKNMSAAEKKNVNPRVVFFAGKAAPAYYIAKLVRFFSFSSLFPSLLLVVALPSDARTHHHPHRRSASS